jgi:hypothetical protein
MDIITIACIVGFIGDFLLQTGVKNGMGGPTGWGLKDYFIQHGSTESLFIAAGMMTIFYSIYIILGFPLKLQYLIIYGIILDFIFRKFMIFSSLKEYYTYFNYFWSAVWGAIPLMIPLILFSLK